jgi:hypothetical protein
MDARNDRQLATSNEKPGLSRLFHFPLNTDLPVSIPVIQYDLIVLTNPWNPAGFILHKQINEHEGYDRRV